MATSNATFAGIEAEIESLLSTPDEDLSEEQKAAIERWLDDLAGMEAAKVDRAGGFIRDLKARSQAVKEEGRRLLAKASALESRAMRLTGHYKEIMERAGLKRIRGEVYDMSLRRVESVQVDDMEALEKFEGGRFVDVKVEKRPMKTAIREAMKAGEFVPGARLEAGSALMIR